jgi:hypothetical protein
MWREPHAILKGSLRITKLNDTFVNKLRGGDPLRIEHKSVRAKAYTV